MWPAGRDLLIAFAMGPSRPVRVPGNAAMVRPVASVWKGVGAPSLFGQSCHNLCDTGAVTSGNCTS